MVTKNVPTYLEIGPRQTGKTQRLLKAALREVRNGTTHRAVFVAMNATTRDRLQERWETLGGPSRHVFLTAARSSLWKNMMSRVNKGDALYADEFDFFPNGIVHQLLQYDWGHIRMCTTPANLRPDRSSLGEQDALVAALLATKGQFTRYALPVQKADELAYMLRFECSREAEAYTRFNTSSALPAFMWDQYGVRLRVSRRSIAYRRKGT